MTQYPMTFQVSSKSVFGIQTTWTSRSQALNQEIPIAIPPEFEGPGGGFSPEDIYAMALQNCFMATFKVFAEKSKLEYQSIGINSTLEVDRDEKGRPWMARIHFKIKLYGAQRKENALRILERTSQSCMILNSVNTQKTFDFELSE